MRVLFIIVFACQHGIAKSNDSSIIKLGDGEIELSQKIDAESWQKAKYKNDNIAFDFVLEDPSRSFFKPYSTNIGAYYKLDLGPFGRASDFQCFYIDMASGCITKESYGNDCADDNSKTSEDIDPRVQAKITIVEYEQLKGLNGQRTEKACGITLDNNGNVNVIKKNITTIDAKKTANFQKILNACKIQCNTQDLSNIDTTSIVVIPKTQIATINNIAYYMERNGMYASAIDLLTKVIAADPERIPAYLNLGDALFKNNENSEARKNYLIYSQKMKQSGKENKIPERVRIRMEMK